MKHFGAKVAACEGRVKLAGIDADEFGAEAAGDHVAGEVRGGEIPERKERFDAGRLELLFAVGAYIAKKEIAERDGVDALAGGAKAGFGHAAFVLLVGTGPRQRNFPERKVSGRGLGFEDRAAGSMHSNAVEFGVDGGKQGNDFEIGLLAEEVKGPCAVFAAAPGDEDTFDV